MNSTSMKILFLFGMLTIAFSYFAEARTAGPFHRAKKAKQRTLPAPIHGDAVPDFWLRTKPSLLGESPSKVSDSLTAKSQRSGVTEEDHRIKTSRYPAPSTTTTPWSILDIADYTTPRWDDSDGDGQDMTTVNKVSGYISPERKAHLRESLGIKKTNGNAKQVSTFTTQPRNSFKWRPRLWKVGKYD